MVKATQALSNPTTNLHPRPKCKTIDLSTVLNKAPKLSLEQAGHLRHFHNLSSTVPGVRSHTGFQEPGQEFLDAKPWTRDEVEGRPWIDEVGLEMGVDVLRWSWVVDEEVEAMVITVRAWDGYERR
jgi:hypothetical protein